MALVNEISSAIKGGRSQAFLSDGVDFVVLDVVTSFSESNTFRVSQHTIEDGADISDHIDAKPRKWEVECILTDNDLDLLDPSGFFDLTIEERFEILEKYRQDNAVLTYYGHETDIEDVAISSLSKSKGQDIGEGWTLSIALTKMNVATFQTEAIELESRSAATAKGKTAKATKTKTGTPAAAKQTSLLKDLTAGIF